MRKIFTPITRPIKVKKRLEKLGGNLQYYHREVA